MSASPIPLSRRPPARPQAQPLIEQCASLPRLAPHPHWPVDQYGCIDRGQAMLAYGILGNAYEGWIVYAAGPVAALAGLYGPSLTNMMSIRVDETEQGELQGALGAAQGLAMMIGPLVLTAVFYVFADPVTSPIYKPGAPFLLAALLAAISFVAFMMVTTKEDRQVTLKDVPKSVDEPVSLSSND